MKKEQIVNPRIEIAEKIHDELRASLELERKLLKKELTLHIKQITLNTSKLFSFIKNKTFV